MMVPIGGAMSIYVHICPYMSIGQTNESFEF